MNKTIQATMIIAVTLSLGLTINTAYSEDITQQEQEIEKAINQLMQQYQTPEQNSVPEQNNTGTNLPDWVRSVAGFWASGLITDQEFINAIQYMINNGLITITGTGTTPTSPTSPITPPTTPTPTPTSTPITIDRCFTPLEGWAYVTGRYTADKSYSAIFFDFNLLDRNDRVVQTTTLVSPVQSIYANETRPFSGFILYDGSWESCEIVIRTTYEGNHTTPKPVQSGIRITTCGDDTHALGWAEARGTFTANANYDQVHLYILLTNSKGEIVDYVLGNIKEIRNGETRNFEISSFNNDIPYTTCTVIIGGYIPA